MKKIIINLWMIVLCGNAYATPTPLSGKHDSQAPIEINSDALEVRQQENLAIFTGHVVAIQGDTRLTSDKMNVHYQAPAADKSAPAAPAPQPVAAMPGGKDSIKKIDVEGNVFLSTPEETASGATGDYDVEKQEIHLHTNVVLTKGANVLKGDALVYNLTTGKSVLTGGAGGNDTKSGAPKKFGRVRALFIPNSDKADQGKK